MKLKNQFVMTILFFSATAVLITASVVYENEEVNKVEGQQEIANRIERGIGELNYLSVDYLLYGEAQQHVRWEAKWQAVAKDINALTPGTSAQRAMAETLKHDSRSLRSVFNNVSNKDRGPAATGDPQAIQDALRTSWSRLAYQNQETAFDALRLSRALSEQKAQLTRTSIILILILVSAFFSYFVANYLFVSRRALRGLTQLQLGTKAIGSGNLDYRLATARSDEIGDLARSFNSMAANLKNITASKTELEKEVAERVEAEFELRRLSISLEELVAERTAKLSDSELRLKRLSGQLLNAQEVERQRIGRELHDGVGQLLTGVKFRIEKSLHEMKNNKIDTSYLEAVVPILQECVKEVRRVQRDLHPPSLEALGIIPTLQALCRDFAETYPDVDPQCRLRLNETAVSAQRKTAIYRVAQEAMNNVVKHSGADTVIVSLTKRGGVIRLSVKDNGRGFNPDALVGEGSSAGLGLSSMRERIEPDGGHLIIESVPDKGTDITATWPL